MNKELILKALLFIIKHATTSREKKLAQLGKEMLSNGKIILDGYLESYGVFDPLSKEIRINPNVHRKFSDVIDTLMHELLHAGHDKLGHQNDLMREEIEAWNLGRKFKNKYIREIGKIPSRTKPFTFNELWEKYGYKHLSAYKGHTGKGVYNEIRKTFTKPGVRKGLAKAGTKVLKALMANPKVLLIALAVIALAVGTYFLVKYLRNRPPKIVTPTTRVETTLKPSTEPEITLTPSSETETRLTQPTLTYNNIHFIKNTEFFLSEGNNDTDTPPDMSEGRYQDRLNTVANDMKMILTASPKQIFLILGHAADIPGFDQGKIILATERVEKVRNILVELGVPSNNLEIIPVGGTNRWGDNLTERTQQPNRVVTFELK